MRNLEGTKTLENLKTAFAGESQAHTKYQYYASKAKKEGYNVIANIFEETSKNEKEHAKIWFKIMHGDEIPVTKQNLLDAIKGEDYEYKTMYADFAKVAKEEGFNDIAALFTMVGNIEEHHSDRYQAILNKLDKEEIFKADEPIFWICSNCGHVHKGKTPPALCPVCKHPQAYFIEESNYFKG